MSGERDLGSTGTNNTSSSRQEFIADLKAVRAKGKAANLTEEQIDDLFFRSPWIEELSPVRTLMRNSFKLMTKCTYVLTVILCLFICVNQLDILAPYVSEFASAYEYPIVRISRKFLMYSGLHKVLAEYDFASAPCILDNPLFAAPTPPCISDCYDAAFAEYSAEDASTLRNYSYREMTHLFVYRGASSPSSSSSSSSVSLSDIQRVLRPHADEVVKRARIFYSNVKDFFTWEDFLSSHDAEKLLDDDDDDDNKDDFNDALARGSYCFTIRQRDECPPQEKQDRIRRRLEETGDAAATAEAETAGDAAVEEKVAAELKAAVEAEPAAQESALEEDLQFKETSEDNMKEDALTETTVGKAQGDDQRRSPEVSDEAGATVNDAPKEAVAGDGVIDDPSSDDLDADLPNDIEDDVDFGPCPTYSIRLEQGDFAYLNGYFWMVEAHPCEDQPLKRNYGLTYLGMFA